MIRVSEIRLQLEHAPEALPEAVARRLGVSRAEIGEFSVVRRGYDARKRGRIALVYSVDCVLPDEAAILSKHSDDPQIRITPETRYEPVDVDVPALLAKPDFQRPVVVGAGPCGLMAALILAQMGLKPIILERGKPVRERTVDTFALWRKSELTPESNVQFGEGGAGTFSDGKLYTRVNDARHLGRKVLEEFVRAGAPEEILYLSKPHIGTFRLVSMVEHMRKEIEAAGGTYRFHTRVEQLLLDEKRQVRGVRLSDGEEILTRHVILAVGHSARDTFEMLHAEGVAMEAKPFSIGVRIEHPQSLIDADQFGPQAGSEILGAADYKLVHRTKDGRGVYSFCMCPGGTVVAATSEPERVVTNGMSQYSRAERNANAGIVVELKPGVDYPDDPLAGVAFQRHWESQAFVAGGGDYRAPAQRVEDFLAERPSTHLGEVTPSYRPGVTPTSLDRCLPDFVCAAIREALPLFARKLSSFALGDAVMTGVETRTSSPLQIPRRDDGESLNTPGLFPAGEGAGYAGGIMSAAMDGIRIAEAVALALAGRQANGLLRGKSDSLV
ncbi:MAG: FAD-dependent protein [Acetobacter aceti]